MSSKSKGIPVHSINKLVVPKNDQNSSNIPPSVNESIIPTSDNHSEQVEKNGDDYNLPKGAATAELVKSTAPVAIKTNNDPIDKIILKNYLKKPLQEILKEIPGYELGNHQPLIISSTESVASVLDSLHQHGVRCAVIARRVWRPFSIGRSTPFCSSFFEKYSEYSFFDDLCYHVMRLYQLSPWKSVEEILMFIQKEKIGKIANISQRVPFIPYQISQPLSDVVAGFVHSCRVPIFDGQHLIRVLAPSDLLSFLCRGDIVEQLSKRGNIRDMAMRQVLTIRESESLLKAMTLMERHGYSAIPIVSEEKPDKVLDVITVKDIKYLLTAQQRLGGKDVLNAPALVYVRMLRSETVHTKHTTATAQWAFFPCESELCDIFDIFARSQIHRLILQDNHGRMTGMLSLSDTMKKLAELLSA